MKIEIFDDVIKNETTPYLLLGNGFSMSIWDKFNYKTLFDVARHLTAEKNLSNPLVSIFDDLATCDFEKVLAYLNIAERITKHYRNQTISDRINSDLNLIKNAFIDALVEIHPDKQTKIDQNKYIQLREFLANFSKIFTTNYDSLLYWTILVKENNSFVVPDNDGFFKNQYPNQPTPIWNRPEDQKIYYVHGSLFLFDDFEYNIIYKLSRTDVSNLLKKIKDEINKNNNPLIVLEGKSNQKIQHIHHNRYLSYCYEQLRTIAGSLFIFGHSLNPHGDEHIIKALKYNNNLKSIYVGLYDKNNESELIETANSLRKSDRTVIFVDSKSAFKW